MICGILLLRPGARDKHTTHPRDEINYILSGTGYLQVRGESVKIEKGKVYYVSKDVEHHFYGNDETLVVLCMFGGGKPFPLSD